MFGDETRTLAMTFTLAATMLWARVRVVTVGSRAMLMAVDGELEEL
jgi:hypothetical protein